MALVVKHNSTADGDPLIDGDDWNANHTITGGGTFRIPKLIESKTLTEATTATFSNLNGDADLEYLFLFDWVFDTTTEKAVYLLPGSATPDDFKGMELINGLDTPEDGKGFLCNCNSWAKGLSQGHITINSKTGKRRSSYGFRSNIQGDNTRTYGILRSHWNVTNVNITSLVLTVDSGNSVTGTAKLYKMVDLTI